MSLLDLLFGLSKIRHPVICNNEKLVQGGLLQHELPEYASELTSGIIQLGSQDLFRTGWKTTFDEVLRQNAELLLYRIPCAAFRGVYAI